MNKRSLTVLIFIFIILVMFVLFPKSCGKSQGSPQAALTETPN